MSDRLAPEPVSRRDFLGLAGLWTTVIAVLGAVVGMARLPKPHVLPEAGARFRIGAPDEFPAGTERVVPDRKVFIAARPEGIAAISLVCTHLGCVVAKVPQGFSCPCHGSAFATDGGVTAGPAPRGLRWLEVSQAADGSIVVDGAREVDKNTYYRV